MTTLPIFPITGMNFDTNILTNSLNNPSSPHRRTQTFRNSPISADKLLLSPQQRKISDLALRNLIDSQTMVSQSDKDFLMSTSLNSKSLVDLNKSPKKIDSDEETQPEDDEFIYSPQTNLFGDLDSDLGELSDSSAGSGSGSGTSSSDLESIDFELDQLSQSSTSSVASTVSEMDLSNDEQVAVALEEDPSLSDNFSSSSSSKENIEPTSTIGKQKPITRSKKGSNKKTAKKTAAFFNKSWPTVWSNVKVNKNKSIDITLCKSMKETDRVIYIWENTVTKQCLIGKSGNFNGRVSGYKGKFNDTNTKVSQFVKDVKQNPKSFRLGILYKLEKDEDLDDFESSFIKHKQKKITLYNGNGGGGGGSARKEEIKGFLAILSPTKSPSKSFPIVNGRVKWSPGTRKKLKELPASKPKFYRFKHIETNEKYVGNSVKPTRRAVQHLHNAKKWKAMKLEDSSYTKGGKLSPALAKDSSKFVVGVYDNIFYENPDHMESPKKKRLIVKDSSGEMERLLIEQMGSIENGLNSNKGGGGPIGKQAKEVSKESLASQSKRQKRKREDD
ncbi:MAG: hypothetical protein H0W88_03150 [Parachlamydiaceae bacterium]|nr:hypothetical protein [Parachlamydiaceae bacterium]